MKIALGLALSSAGLLPCFCSSQLTELEAPSMVTAGRPFPVTVHGSGQPVAPGCGAYSMEYAVVLQIPVGFQFVGNTKGLGFWQRDDPSVLGLYTPESGARLISFGTGYSPGAPWLNDSLTIELIAPPAFQGVIKTAIASRAPGAGWILEHPRDPVAGPLSDFAQIGGRFETSIRSASTALDPGFERLLRAPTEAPRVVADFDGDGGADVVHLEATTTPGRPLLHVDIVRGGIITRRATTLLSNTQMLVGSIAEDYDQDGDVDLLTGAGFLPNRGDGTFGPERIAAFAGGPHAVGDLNADGVDDVAWVDRRQNLQLIRSRNGGAGVPVGTGIFGSFVTDLRIGDVDGDGDADIVVIDNDRVQILLGNGVAGPNDWTPLAPSIVARRIAIGDLDGDGIDDVIVGTPSGAMRQVSVAGGQSQVLALQTAPLLANEMRVVDLDGDGSNELVVLDHDDRRASYTWPRLVILERVGPLAYREMANTGLSARGRWNYWLADLDGDGFVDFVDGWGDAWSNRLPGRARFGQGCGGAFEPRLGSTWPQLGDPNFALELEGARSTGALVWLGTSRSVSNGISLPLSLDSLGAPGCTVWAAADAGQLLATNASGLARWRLPIPNAPQLHGSEFFAQGAVFVSAVNPLGVALSKGLTLRID